MDIIQFDWLLRSGVIFLLCGRSRSFNICWSCSRIAEAESWLAVRDTMLMNSAAYVYISVTFFLPVFIEKERKHIPKTTSVITNSNQVKAPSPAPAFVELIAWFQDEGNRLFMWTPSSWRSWLASFSAPRRTLNRVDSWARSAHATSQKTTRVLSKPRWTQ